MRLRRREGKYKTFFTELATAFQENATGSSRAPLGKPREICRDEGQELHLLACPTSSLPLVITGPNHSSRLGCIIEASRQPGGKPALHPEVHLSLQEKAPEPYPQALASDPVRSAWTTAGAVGRSSHDSGLVTAG